MTARRGLVLVALALSFVVVGVVASRRAASPARCGDGLVALGARCCGEGQRVDGEGRCVGAPSRCGEAHVVAAGGCLPKGGRVPIEAGSVTVGPSDWEAQGLVERRVVRAGAFEIDVFEAHGERLARCVEAGRCAGSLPARDEGAAVEVSIERARELCAFEGGRLPSEAEWLLAAMGEGARRYPWGETGAVCRRASFGLVDGPCGQGATGPDTVGSRPSGRSAQGVYDLAGNAAEWVIDEGGRAKLAGGSYRSTSASSLRGWKIVGAQAGDVGGVRCVRPR